jgi:FMN phosphatase YigB (HAD superfamily)
VTRPTTVLLLDFDGTVAVGHGPVHAYARAAAASLAPTVAARFRDEAEAAIEAWGTGADGTTTDELLPLDGYDLVRVLAERHGVGPHALSAAYLASRHALGTADAPVAAPDGLADLLAEIRPHATIVLATNAPQIRLVETLTDLGVAPLLDRILTEVGKPAGMPRLLDAVGATPQGPARVLSVGDVWVNDLAPVAARGHATALVARTPPSQARPTYLGPDLPSLYPDLHQWVADGVARPLAVPTTTEG